MKIREFATGRNYLLKGGYHGNDRTDQKFFQHEHYL
jgi:hypothetical protein